MCPIPQLRLVGVKTSYIFFFSYFLDTLSSEPHYKSLFGAPLLAASCYASKEISACMYHETRMKVFIATLFLTAKH